MKNYREIADSVLARRDQYVIAQHRKKQTVTRVTASVGSVALVSLAGFALLRGDAFRNTPPIADDPVTATTVPVADDTTAVPTASTTSATESEPTADATECTDANKTEQPTTTTVPSRTQPSQTTASAPTSTTVPAQEKVWITADKPDRYGTLSSDEVISRHGVYISPMLRETMEQYKEVNAVYFVIVELPATEEDYDDFSSTDEELLRLEEAEKTAYQKYLAAKEEAGGYTAEVWALRQEYRAIASQYNSLKDKLMEEHIQAVLTSRVNDLACWSHSELVSLATDTRFRPVFAYACDRDYAFLMELTADEIHALAERGGYVIRLACPDGEEDYLVNDGLL